MITINNLSKRYGDKLAVDDLTFSVAPGEVLGFLGANGAGKSTTTAHDRRLHLTHGRAGFGLRSRYSQRTGRGEILHGIFARRRASYGEMTVSEFLDFVADVRGLNGERRRDRRAVVIDRLGLAPVIDQVVETIVQRIPPPRRIGTGVDPRSPSPDPG